LGATASEKLAARTKVKNNGPLEKKDEVVANVIWRFLELRGCASLYIPSLRIDSQVCLGQVPDKFPHSLAAGAGDVYCHPGCARQRQIPGFALSVFGTYSGWCDARALVVPSRLQWRAEFRNWWVVILAFLVFWSGRISLARAGTLSRFRFPALPFLFTRFAFRPKRFSYRITDLQYTDDEKSCMLLVMRVLSIVPLSFKVRCFTAT
jgi:hypothetical protein